MLDAFYEEHAVPRETRETLAAYRTLLLKWQKAKNLVAPSTVDTLDTRHFLDSLQLIPILQRHGITGPILDMGSGAGFPGLVLALAGFGPVHLVESNGKKASFLRTVIRETGARAIVHNDRIESLTPFPIAAVTARACATLRQLVDWAEPFLSQNPTFILLKGEKCEEELTEARKSWDMDSAFFQSITDATGQIVVLENIRKAGPV